jgi:cation transport ATPase
MAARDANWQYLGFRRTLRMMPAVWGLAYVVEAFVRVGLVFALLTSAFLIASQVMVYGVTAVLIAWTMRYGQGMEQRATAHAKRV